jgi:hypothetical protein
MKMQPRLPPQGIQVPPSAEMQYAKLQSAGQTTLRAKTAQTSFSWKRAALIAALATLVVLVCKAPKKQMLNASMARMQAAPDHGALAASILNLTILTTNDLHSAVTGIGPEAIPHAKRGGFARLSSHIKAIRSVSFELCLFPEKRRTSMRTFCLCHRFTHCEHFTFRFWQPLVSASLCAHGHKLW